MGANVIVFTPASKRNDEEEEEEGINLINESN